MDRSSNHPTPAQGQTPAHRDIMYCHLCKDEWYRDEHGLNCPQCGSDFTEIIEEGNDPRDRDIFGDDDDDDSMPDLTEAPPHGLPHHNPWQSDDPEEGDISNLQFTQTAPGRYNVQATITRSMSPQEFRAGGGLAPATLGGFMSMINGLAGNAIRQQQQQQQQQQQREREQQQQREREQQQSRAEGDANPQPGDFSQDPDPNQSAFRAFQESRDQNTHSGPQFRATRFQYHGGARLFPRDANNPEARIEPVDDITNVVTGLMAALGAPPATVHTHHHAAGGTEARFNGGADDHAHLDHPHPFFGLFSSLGLTGPPGQMGDFVYSQEGLDRIITQLMEQTASSNAPGPATQADIDNLQRKKVDEDMLGAEHKAECSICMEEVNIGEEVTVLPCKHWFHHVCVASWLSEHDTCPHCRQGISKHNENAASSQQPGGQQSESRPMPGSFDYAGGDSSQGGNASSSSAQQNANSDAGIAERVRRGWFSSGQ